MAKEMREIIAFHEQLASGDVAKLTRLEDLHNVVDHAEQKGALLPTMPYSTNRTQEESVLEASTWEEELHKLKGVIDGSKQAFEDGNEISLKGWYTFFEKIKEMTTDRGTPATNIEEFVEKTLSFFCESYEEYENEANRPVYPVQKKGGTMFQYRRLGGKFLTPRELRVIVFKHGLNGTRLKDFELAKMEEMQTTYQPLQNGYVKTGFNLVPFKHR